MMVDQDSDPMSPMSPMNSPMSCPMSSPVDSETVVAWRSTRPRYHHPKRGLVMQKGSTTKKGKEKKQEVVREEDLRVGLQKVMEKKELEASTKSSDPTVFERDSPRSKATLRSFLCEFLVDGKMGSVEIRNDIDLRKYGQESMRPVTNSTVQEICVMQPLMISLDVSDCDQVGDAGLLAISKHCQKLETLNASSCACTRIGLRALSLGCPQLKTLDLSRCPHVDDPALSALAAGAPHLTELTIRENDQITDDGLAVLARGCRNLTALDVSYCAKVGEFGDRALLALGRYCSNLQRLDMFGCAHVQDAGVVAVARGCSKLSHLRLTGCSELTGAALAALASKSSTSLLDLRVAGCHRLQDADLKRLVAGSSSSGGEGDAALSPTKKKGCRNLTRLDVSGCRDVKASGIRAVVNGCPDLVELILRGCEKVSDDACAQVAARSTRLRKIDLGGCPVTERGVAQIARQVTGLDKLDVTDCKNISRRFLLKLVDELKFVDLARDFVGLQPKPNADYLRRRAEKLRRQNRHATVVQKLWRGSLARAGLRSVKRRRFVERVVTRFQAGVRGFSARKKVAELFLRRREVMAATWFAALWRGFVVRRFIETRRRQIRLVKKHTAYALVIQRYYRAHASRKRVRAFRAAVEAVRLEQAKEQAQREINATSIQALYRGCAARTRVDAMRRELARIEARRLLEWISSIRIQSAIRMRFGYKVLVEKKRLREFELMKWRVTRIVQAVVRGRRARRLAELKREENRQELRRQAAVKIQGMWRATRARFLATIAAAMEALRYERKGAVVKLQASSRRWLAEKRADRIRDEKAEFVRRQSAALLIQRVLRGHYGRTAWEVAKRLALLRKQAAPLYSRLEVLREEARVAAEECAESKAKLAQYKLDTREIILELNEVSRVGHEFWDTARITGHTQRFRTKFLKERFIELLAHTRARVAEYSDLSRIKTVASRDKERLIREVRRELAPLADGLAERTRRERVDRLRATVRRQRAAATRIQALVRSKCVIWALVRLASSGSGQHQWESLLDEATNEHYFWNAVTGETRWDRPLELDFPQVNDWVSFFQNSRFFGSKFSTELSYY